MNKFSVVYANEVKKMFKGKSLFVIALVVVLLLALLTFSVEMLLGNIEYLPPNTNVVTITTPEQGIIVYEELTAQIEAEIKNGTYKPRFNDNSLRTCKRMVTYYKFLQTNNLSVGEVQPYGASGDITAVTSSFGYVTMVMQSVLMLAIIAVIIYGSSNIMGELKGGALKMQLLRPVSRGSMLSAKSAAAMTGGMFIYTGATVVAIIYAMFRFRKFMLPQVVFFNDTTASLVSSGGMFAIQFLSGILTMLFFCSLTYAVGFLSDSKNVAMAVPLGLLLVGDLVSMGLGYIYIGYIDPLYNLNFMNTMSTSNTIYAGSNVLVSVAIILAYIATLIAYNYITFKKRDLN